MKFIKNYNLFNEGLFGDHTTDDEVAQAIYDKLAGTDFTPILDEGETYVIKHIKLDTNPGVYNIYIDKHKLILKYYKFSPNKDILSDGVLIFTKELDCGSYVRGLILTLIKNKLR